MNPPLIILPFYCQDEVDQFCWMIERWYYLTYTRRKYEFLLVSRFDFNGDVSRLAKLCSEWAPTNYVQLEGSKTGFPAGPNEMWMNSMKELKKRNARFGFLMEYDVMPNKQDWFTILSDAWDGEYLMSGHLVTEEWIESNGYGKREDRDWGRHINGAALYNPDIVGVIEDNRWHDRFGWDVQIYNMIERKEGFQLYDFRINPNRDSKEVVLGCMMTHGVKTIEAKQKLFDETAEQNVGN